MEIFFEILKYTLPALIVMATAYYILKKLVDNQYHMQALELKSKYAKDAIPLKLQAYERLILFCDRMDVRQLIMRLKTSEMRSIELKNVMMISIQKEYEHNIAQQLYTSAQLWQIITLAKNDMISFIENNAKSVDMDSPSNNLADHLLKQYVALEKNPVQIAVEAIKEEAKIILNV